MAKLYVCEECDQQFVLAHKYTLNIRRDDAESHSLDCAQSFLVCSLLRCFFSCVIIRKHCPNYSYCLRQALKLQFICLSGYTHNLRSEDFH